MSILIKVKLDNQAAIQGAKKISNFSYLPLANMKVVIQSAEKSYHDKFCLYFSLSKHSFSYSSINYVCQINEETEVSFLEFIKVIFENLEIPMCENIFPFCVKKMKKI